MIQQIGPGLPRLPSPPRCFYPTIKLKQLTSICYCAWGVFDVVTKKLVQFMEFRICKRPARRGLARMLGCALLLQLPLALADGAIPATLDGNKLFETHDPEVKVSGNVIVGVMVAGAYQGLSKDLLGIRPPDAGDKAVCLKVTSRDGAYMSENNYGVKISQSDIVYLPYVSNLTSIVEEYSEPGSIAISATQGNCEQAATAAYFLPALLNEKRENLESGDLSIYINGFDATDVAYRIIESGTDLDDCDYIKEGRHTAYNFSCVIPRDKIPEADEITIEIAREVYGRELDSLTFRLLDGQHQEKP